MAEAGAAEAEVGQGPIRKEPLRSPLRALALRLASVGVSILLTLVLLEVTLRFFYPVPLHATDTYLSVPARGMQAGAMTLVPGAVVREKNSEFDVTIRINSHGFRDREFTYEKPPGTYRILALGDSQTFGHGVEAQESYAKGLEKLLQATASCPVEVINTGVPGTGTVHQLWLLEEKGWKYQPDAVVLGFFYNDITDNAQSLLYGLENGRLVRTARASHQATGMHRYAPSVPEHGDFRALHAAEPLPRPEPPLWIRHFHLARFVRLSLSRFRHSRREAERPARAMTAALVAEIARQCRERNVPFTLTLIPGLQQEDDPRIKSLYQSYEPLLKGAEITHEQVVDPWLEFKAHGFQSLFFPVDTHMTVPAHGIIAERLATRFRRLEPRLRANMKE